MSSGALQIVRLTSCVVLAFLLSAIQLGCWPAVRNADVLLGDPHFSQAEVGDAPGCQAHNEAALAALGNLDLDEAEREWELAIADPTPCSVAHTNLARLYYLLNEEEFHRFSARRMAHRREQFSDAWLLERATTLATTDRTEEARVLFHAMLERGRSVLEASLWLAADRMANQDFGSARAHYDQVLALEPNHPEALFGLGYIYYAGDHTDRAADLLERARQSGCEERLLPYYLADALYREEEYQAALDVAQAAGGESRTLEILRLHGEILLVIDFRHDLSPLLQGLPEEDQALLMRAWYGDEDYRGVPEMRSEFELLY